MAYILPAILAIFLLAQPGLPRPEEAGAANFEQLIKEFQVSIEKSVDEAKKNMPKDGAGVIKAIKEQSEKAEIAMKDMKAKLDEAIQKNPQISEAMAGLKTKIEEARAKIKKEMPEVDANAQKMADAMKSAYDGVAKEMEKISAEVNKKGGLKDDMTELMKKLIDDGTNYAKNFEAQIKEMMKTKSYNVVDQPGRHEPTVIINQIGHKLI
uniref:JR-1 n=1 Tax=Riptortus clavatus TaxID=41704 RepID=O02025_RIPCL|nr:JR-1 [Riptortus clavatus]